MPAAYNNVLLTIIPLGIPHTHWSFPIAAGRVIPGFGTFISEFSYIPSLVEKDFNFLYGHFMEWTQSFFSQVEKQDQRGCYKKCAAFSRKVLAG
jgi:hypothetical protein